MCAWLPSYVTVTNLVCAGPGQRNIRRQAGGNVSAMPQRDLVMVRRPVRPVPENRAESDSSQVLRITFNLSDPKHDESATGDLRTVSQFWTVSTE